MEDITFMPATDLIAKVRSKELSPVEVTHHFLGRIEALNPHLNAFLTVCGDEALTAAKEAEASILRGDATGALHGLPIAIKDLNLTRGIRTTRGSTIYRDSIPDHDDILVERVKAAGAVIVGKTNTPEFGHRGTTENRLGEPCRNPWDTTRTTGGSSGGAGGALAAGMVPIAQGSDGGGSIRIPSSLCGVYGIKPTQGRVPRLYEGFGGLGPLGQNGPMALTVRDAVLLFGVLSGHDGRDPTSVEEPLPDFTDALRGDVRGLRIAWSPDFGYAAVEPEVAAAALEAVRVLENLGAHVEEATPPIDGETVFDTFRHVFFADYVANWGPLVPGHGDEMTPFLREELEWMQAEGVAAYTNALREMERHRYRMRHFYEGYDLLVSPATATTAFPIEQFPETIDGRPVEKMWGFTPFTYPINLSGQTAASVPIGFSSAGLPIGLQIAGPKFAEANVVRASAALEAAMPWRDRHPVVG
jgi:Asp-tRNA(Asn)/Glu-tRNA(Gln) amidotransferase A subunit family amidase